MIARYFCEKTKDIYVSIKCSEESARIDLMQCRDYDIGSTDIQSMRALFVFWEERNDLEQ